MRPWRKLGQGQHRVIIYINYERLECYVQSFVKIGPPVPEKIFKGSVSLFPIMDDTKESNSDDEILLTARSATMLGP